jgi:hypothetical protein
MTWSMSSDCLATALESEWTLILAPSSNSVLITSTDTSGIATLRHSTSSAWRVTSGFRSGLVRSGLIGHGVSRLSLCLRYSKSWSQYASYIAVGVVRNCNCLLCPLYTAFCREPQELYERGLRCIISSTQVQFQGSCAAQFMASCLCSSSNGGDCCQSADLCMTSLNFVVRGRRPELSSEI